MAAIYLAIKGFARTLLATVNSGQVKTVGNVNTVWVTGGGGGQARIQDSEGGGGVRTGI